jgi:amino acid transporter
MNVSGWTLVLEYTVGVAAIARGWSGYTGTCIALSCQVLASIVLSPFLILGCLARAVSKLVLLLCSSRLFIWFFFSRLNSEFAPELLSRSHQPLAGLSDRRYTVFIQFCRSIDCFTNHWFDNSWHCRGELELKIFSTRLFIFFGLLYLTYLKFKSHYKNLSINHIIDYFFFFHLVGPQSSNANIVLCSIKVFVLSTVIFGGFILGDRSNWTDHPFAPNGTSGILAGSATLVFAYSGEETSNIHFFFCLFDSVVLNETNFNSHLMPFLTQALMHYPRYPKKL